MMGLFITFEGMDKTGKSTQTGLFCDYLRKTHPDMVQTREPGGCGVSELIRQVILTPGNDMGAACEAMLYAASRCEHVRQVIKPALEAGRLVVSDRFVDSSITYQGYGRQLGHRYVAELNAAATQGLQPNITFFLRMDHEQAIKRIHQRDMDRLEIVDTEFRRRVAEGYKRIISEDAERFIIIDADGSVQDVHAAIVQAYEARVL